MRSLDIIGASGVFALFLILMAVVLVFSMVKMVPQGYQYTVESFGNSAPSRPASTSSSPWSNVSARR